MKIMPSARLSYQLIDESDSEFLFQLDQEPRRYALYQWRCYDDT